jgi:amino acid efflux transporter
MEGEGSLGVVRGAALYVGALVGPGLLLVPALAVQTAGAASIVAWGALIVLSAPVALLFAELGIRHPVAGGVYAYARAGFGDEGAVVTGGWFIAAVFLGVPAVAQMGGNYVANLTGSGTPVATAVGLGMFGTVLAANALGLRLSSGFQLAIVSLLVGVVAVAIGVALPSHATHHWHPFAPHGWWAIGTAANILVWLFVGWEAMAQLAGDFRRPAIELPRAVALAFVIVTALYLTLAVATIGVTSGTTSRVPLADLMSVGFGRAGRDATAVLAVALTMGTMNVYIAGTAKLIASLANERALPPWLGRDSYRSVPRRPLLLIGAVGVVGLAIRLAGVGSIDAFVRGTSACFISVYVLVFAAAVRILEGRLRNLAMLTLVLTLVVTVFSSWYLLVPAFAGAAAIALRRLLAGRSTVTV